MAITVKHSKVSTIPDDADTSLVRPSDWNADHTLTGTVPVANGGTGASTAADGLNNLLPSQTGNNGKVLATDGTNATWTTNGSGDVVGPSSATDNAVARFDTTTGKLIQNSGVTIDDNSNITANALDDGYLNTAASGTLITLTSASVRRYTITGSGGQTIKLPDATTLVNGTVFQFDNNQSSGAITVNNNSNTLVVSVPSGGFVLVNLLSNATAAGSWDRHDQAPANVSWSTNTFDYAGSITSATWNGNTVAVNRGGTGVTTSTGSGSNVLNTSPTLTTPTISGGTIDNTVIGGTTPAAGTFTTLGSTGTATLASGSTTYVTITGDASYPMVKATGGTNTPLVLSPLGTGALQAQKTDSTATGGNARGANAVDWQTNRSAATYVASGSNSVIAGGVTNVASGGQSVVSGGGGNSSTGAYTTVAGGQNNTSLGQYSPIGGGYQNTVSGYFNFVGGGSLNSATASAAVTTNTTTIALSAASTVYLSSTNANIKIGQMITGTGVTFPNTYATSTVTTGTAAVMNTSTISGTTLTVGSLASGTIIAGMVLTGTGVTAGTYIVSGSASTWTVSTSQTVSSTTITGTAYTFTISQNATTAAGVTLSFYTPHGVVVGGGNNQATGSYSFIGGGGDAGTAANRNVASGDWSTVGGGFSSQATGLGSVVVGGGIFASGNTAANIAGGIGAVVIGGAGNQALADRSSVIGGYGNQIGSASGNTGAAIIGGFGNVASGTYATFLNGYQSTTRGINFNMSYAGRSGLSTSGNAQSSFLVLAKATTDATATVLTSDTSAASTTNQVILPNNSAYAFTANVISTAQFNLATTATAGSAGTATITFAAQTVAPFIVGQTIVVAGVTPAGYNGTYTVTACTTTTVQYANATTGAQTVAGTVAATSLTKAWKLDGCIMRTSAAAGTRLVGSVTSTVIATDTGTAAWTAVAAADTTNGGLKITFTGAAATTIRTVAQVRTTEVTY